MGRVLTGLHLRDRVQAVMMAYETGLVVADEREGGTAGVTVNAEGTVRSR